MTQHKGFFVTSFLKHDTAAGMLLIVATALALVMANSPLADIYNSIINTPVHVKIDDFEIKKKLLLWVNDGLMAIFFLLVGLELKREFVEGELSNKRNIILPGLGAIGGMAVPALIYVIFNYDNPEAIKGWAIPAATDIAFALGILSLLGSRVPITLKVFLTSLAIFDDVGAIIIIAIFYTNEIVSVALIISIVCLGILFILNYINNMSKSLYIFVGVIMWGALLKSGIHATLAGVVLALFIPIKGRKASDPSPLKVMEHDLHTMVNFAILPIFAFCNAGLSFVGMGLDQVMHDVPLGIALGLVIGKQVGVFGLCWLGIKIGLTEIPKGMNWGSLYGAAALCGIGFTMSLFIGKLAFPVNMDFDPRLGILLGSLVSGCLGFYVLKKCLPLGIEKISDNKAV